MDACAKKQEANRAHYAKIKGRQEAALLRLDVGDLAKLDEARAVAGLSRSAFAKLYLLPIASEVAARFEEVELTRSAGRMSLATFIARALDLALRPPEHSPSSAPDAGEEFDRLFRGGAEEET